MEKKKKVKKRENQPTIDPFSGWGVGGWGASKLFAKEGSLLHFLVYFCSTKIERPSLLRSFGG